LVAVNRLARISRYIPSISAKHLCSLLEQEEGIFNRWVIFTVWISLRLWT